MANNVDIKSEVSVKRVEAISSRRSSFFLGVSNRVLLPLSVVTIFMMINVSIWWLAFYILFFIMEIVLTYLLKMTLTEMAGVIWDSIFGTEIKSVKN